MPNFFTATSSKDRPTVDGKHSAKCRAYISFGRALNPLNSNIECLNAFAVRFAGPQRKCYKFHSLLGSVVELSGDKLLLSGPSLQLHLWNLLKSSRHVTSPNQGALSRYREDPRNEVDLTRGCRRQATMTSCQDKEFYWIRLIRLAVRGQTLGLRR